MRRIVLWASLALVQTGCATIQDWRYCAVNQCRADIAWLGAKYSRREIDFYSDFRCGWRTGYYDVAEGRCGRPPAVPPRCYWSAHYQTSEGMAAISAWYRGFQEGAIAAEQDGFGSHTTLPAHGMSGIAMPVPFEAPIALPNPPVEESESKPAAEVLPAAPPEVPPTSSPIAPPEPSAPTPIAPGPSPTTSIAPPSNLSPVPPSPSMYLTPAAPALPPRPSSRATASPPPAEQATPIAPPPSGSPYASPTDTPYASPTEAPYAPEPPAPTSLTPNPALPPSAPSVPLPDSGFNVAPPRSAPMPAFEPATSPSDAPNSPQPASSRKGAWSVKTVSNRETATQEAAAERAFQPAIAPANEPAPSAALHSTLTAYQPASGAVYQSEPGAEDQPAPEPAPLGLRPEGPAIGGRAQATSRNPLTVIRRVAASIVRRQDAAEASSQQATPAGTDCAGNPEKP